ncbi:MAG: AraC family transcriptional regulator [Bacteroidales bacterium]|nr:AraC family transcriptional regulator [Bacteroidales bacterium]
MNNLSIALLVIAISSLATTLSILSVIIGRRRNARTQRFKYPAAGEATGHVPDSVLEEEASVYDISDRKATELMDKFKMLMEENKPYLDPKANIDAIANTLGTNKTTLSKMINDKFGMNFRQLLNSFRVREAILLLSKNGNIGLEDLRIRSGFNSTSTFNSSFSRFTGCTPGEYCKKVTGR